MSQDVAALLARILAEPDLLDALACGDHTTLAGELAAGPAELGPLAALDIPAVRFYLRRLQRKRLEMIGSVFPASLPQARRHHGDDTLAALFWPFCRPPADLPGFALTGSVADAWVRFTEILDQQGPPGWLGELSRYELMRWRAAVAEPRPDCAGGAGGPVLAAGAGVAGFSLDAPLLLRTAMAGHPVARPARIWLMSWRDHHAVIRTARIGQAVYRAVLACDGDHTIAQITSAAVGGQAADRRDRVEAALRAMVEGGALIAG
jgi:hypothetical protein